MEKIQLMDPGQDYDVKSVLWSILSDLGYEEVWIAERLSEIEFGVAQRLQDDSGLGSATAVAPRWHFHLDPTGRELRSHRLDDPAVYDAVQTKLNSLNALKSNPACNAEAFEIICQAALANAMPSALVCRTRLHTDRGVDVYGTIPLENGLGNVYLLCQVKLQSIEGGAEIRTFYGAAQYLLHAHLRHHFSRTPQDLKDFLLQMPMAPAVVLVFCAVSYSPEAQDECVNLGVCHLDFQWVAHQLARSTMPDQ